jgi:rubrerythrin
MEKWLLHEATEVYNYHSCASQEPNPRIKAIWERFLDYELGHLNYVAELFKKHEKRDPMEVLPATLPEPITYASQRDFVRKVLAQEVDLRAKGADFVPKAEEGAASQEYRAQLNSEGSPSEIVAGGYKWTPGTELQQRKAA